MKVQNNPKLTGKVLMVSLLTLMLTAGMLYGQTATIGGSIYTGANDLSGNPIYAPNLATPPIYDTDGAQVMIQNQHSGGPVITYGVFGASPSYTWTATVPAPGDYVVMFSADNHDVTSREFQVDASGTVTFYDPTIPFVDNKMQTSNDPAGLDAYLPPLPLETANLLVFAFLDRYINGEPDDFPEDFNLNGVVWYLTSEDGDTLAVGVTGSQPTITTADNLVINNTQGYYYFTGVPPGEVIATTSSEYIYLVNDPTATAVDVGWGPPWDFSAIPKNEWTMPTEGGPPVVINSNWDASSEFYLNYTEEGGPAWDPKLYPGDPGTEAGNFLIWHSYIERLDQIDVTNVAERFAGIAGVDLDLANAGTISGTLVDADAPNLDPIEPFPIPGEDHPGVSLNEIVPDGLVVLFTNGEGGLVRPVATTEADPVTGDFSFINVPAGVYKTFNSETALDYVWTQSQIALLPGQDFVFPPNSVLVPRFFARGQGYVVDRTGKSPTDPIYDANGDLLDPVMTGQEVYIRYKSGSIRFTETTDASGWYNFDDLPEIEVMGFVDVKLPPGYRGAVITEKFYPNGRPGNTGDKPLIENDITHTAMNRYINWFTANYRADLFLEQIPASTGDIGGYVFNDHLERNLGWVGDGVYQPEEERTMHGVTIELWDEFETTLLADTTTGNFKDVEASVRSDQGWRGAYQWPPDEFGGVFVGPAPGYYEFRDLAPGNYVVKVIPPPGFSPSDVLYPSGTAAVTVAGGARNDVNFGINTLAPLAGEIEGGVWDDVNIDGRGGEFTSDPGDPTSLMFAEKAAIPGAPVGAYDHHGYFLGAMFQGNPLCFIGAPDSLNPDGTSKGVSQCPTGEDPDQKPEAERRFAPGVHIYRGNDPALPGYCGNYLPMDLPYTFGQGKFKFEADWSLMPATFMGLGLMCNDDPLITMTEPTIIAPGAAPVQIFGRAGGKSKGTKLAASPPIILAPGDTYRIQGFDFGDAQGYQTASLAGQPLEVLEWTDNYIDVVIPEDAISGPIVVATTTGHSNALAVEIDYPPARAATMANRSFYVDVSNSGPEDGSKAHPWNSIQEAIDNLPEVSPKYIYVAAGTYYENIKLDKNHVYLIGAGPHETTINGLPRSFNLTSQGPNNGSGPVIFIGRGGIHGAKYDIHISSFTITGGNVNGDDIGCGIFADYGNHDLDINNCRIYRNGGYYGGGIWLHLSNHNVNIWSNLIAENGNYGGYGGGISVNDEPEYTEEHGQPEHIWDDYLPGPPPGTYEIYNNLIFHNWSFDYGGGICMYEIKDHLKLYGNVLLENKSEDHGAGMFFEDCGPIDIYGNVFLRNWTPDDGGAISFEDVGDTLSHVNIYNNLFAENIADDHGENHARGAALALDDVRDANIFNNTIVGNMVSGSFNPAGGGIDSERHGHEYSGQDGPYMAPGYSDPKIFNNIIWGNWRVHYDQVMEGGEEEDLDYTWSKNFVWTPDQLHVDNPHLQEEWENDNNTNSFSYVHNNIIQGGYDYNNQPPTADAGLNQALKDLDNSGSEPVTLDGSGSSDTDGTIVSYLWSENGAPLAYEANPTIDLPQGAHTLTLTVHDERGASHADLVNVTVIPNGPLSFNPTDDAFVRSNRANKNYGDTYEMRVRKSNSAKYHTYLKFNVNGLLGNVTSAKIQLKVINASNQGGSIYPAGNGWDEASLNWNNAPGTTGSSLSSVGAVGLGEIVEFDVTSAISGNGTFSFCISSNSSDAAIYSSKEGTYAPKLLVEFEMAGGNQAPVADAGPNQILSDGDSSGDEDVTLNGSGSYDTDGSIVNYDWSESGSSIASGVSPTVSLSVGVHTITLTVTDDQGATGTDDVVVTVNPGGGGAGSLTFNPIDDSFVRSNKATKNYGGSDELRVRRSSSAKYYTYLKFNVAGVGGAVTNAKLRLKVINASSEGGEIYSVANGWDEGSVNWNNAPALGGSALSSNGPVALGDMVEFDVTSAIAGDGTYSFGIKNSTSDAAKYSSKEGVYAPELVVDFGAGGGNQSPVADAGPNQDVTDADNNGSEGVTLDGSGSFDNDGTIVSYDWSEGGSSIATGLNPAVNLALGVHTITLTVTDNEGATGTDDVVVTVNPGGGGVPGTYTFNPTDDSFVRSNKATKVYGASDELRVRITSKKIYAFLKFNVSGLGGAVVSAKVRLKAINGSNDGGGIYTVENGWDEGSLNWNNAPPIAGAPLSSVGAMATGDMVEFDVTGAIFGNGTYSFAIKNASSDAAKYSSKEGVYAPELVVETTTPGPILAIAKNGAIGLNWNKIANGFGFSGLKGTNGHLQAIGGNLDLDPQFVDPASLNWRLQSNSPAIDQADAGMGAHVDLERLPRSVVNGMIDMGAFEWRANSPMVLRIPTGILGSVPIPTPGSSQLYP